MGDTDSNRGIIDWYLSENGGSFNSFTTGQDWYAGSVSSGVVKTASITISASGYHVLKGIVNGKNASSSNYYIVLRKMWLKPSTD
jgi:hypothetical protein